MLSASRSEMLSATIYLVCKNPAIGKILDDAEPCSMCKRLIINAGIAKVIIRLTMNDFKTVNVEKWVEDDESLAGSEGY
jgi:dCMP deaminase